MTTTPGAALAATITAALASGAADRAERGGVPLVLAAVATGSATSAAVARYLSSCPAVRVGGTVFDGASAVYLAADTPTWAGYAARLARRRALPPLRAFEAADPERVLGPTLTAPDGPLALDAALHPSVGPAGVSPADDHALGVFAGAVALAGGAIARFPMRTGTLTHVAVHVPDLAAARALAHCPVVRSLRPVARLGLR